MNTVLKKRIELMSPDQLVEAMYCDPLTGVWNRRAFCELIEDRLYAAESGMYVAIIDLDSLKWINDTLGHRSGDEALKEVAGLLEEAFPGRTFRLAGDEFLVYTTTFGQLMKTVLQRDDRIYSFGVGTTLIKADAKLKIDKEVRLNFGHRADRGDPPPWNSERFIIV